MKNLKLVYIISDIDKSTAFEWQLLSLREHFSLAVILLNSQVETSFSAFLEAEEIPYKSILCRGKKDWASAIWHTTNYLRQHKPQIVHCHLLQANLIGLIASAMLKIPNRIYTRHHSTEHHLGHSKGVFWDKLSNRLSTKIIAISAVVREVLTVMEKVPVEKVELIPHGFRLEKFRETDLTRINHVKDKYNLSNAGPVIGVISRFTIWKGIQYVIPAFKRLLINYPNAVLLLLNADGSYKSELEKQLKELPDKNLRLIKFEKEIVAMFKSMDVFVHVPVNKHYEGFGQIYVEALASGTPSVFTLSGIAPEFIRNRFNALVVGYENEEDIYNAINELLTDRTLRSELIVNGQASIEYFQYNRFINDLVSFYNNLITLPRFNRSINE